MLSRPCSPNTPLFFRADFTLNADPILGSAHHLRTEQRAAKSGGVSINGHNLGTYENTGNRAAEMYVPECRLKNEVNTMVNLDGASAAGVASAGDLRLKK